MIDVDGTLDQRPCYIILCYNKSTKLVIMLFANIEGFSNACQKTNTSVICLTNHNRANSAMQQSEFLAQSTGTILCIQGAFGFGFVSHLFFSQSLIIIVAICNQVITFESH